MVYFTGFICGFERNSGKYLCFGKYLDKRHILGRDEGSVFARVINRTNKVNAFNVSVNYLSQSKVKLRLDRNSKKLLYLRIQS